MLASSGGEDCPFWWRELRSLNRTRAFVTNWRVSIEGVFNDFYDSQVDTSRIDCTRW